MKIRPGARFGMAVPIVGEVSFIPLRNKDCNIVILHAESNRISLIVIYACEHETQITDFH